MSGAVRLGKRLATLRAEEGVAVDEVAAELEVTAREIEAFESGARIPSPKQIVRLADFYRITVAMLIIKSIPQDRDGKLVTPPTRVFHYGIGRNEEEASRAKTQQKLDELPYFDVDVPDDLTVEELQALVAGHVCIAVELDDADALDPAWACGWSVRRRPHPPCSLSRARSAQRTRRAAESVRPVMREPFAGSRCVFAGRSS